ncbi:MAG: condensation domain-containing protein, partial [Chthoniobacterales bacterium]
VPLTCTAWDANERARWKQPTSFAENIAFWETHLEAAPKVWNRPRPPIETPLQRRVLVIEDELATATRALAKRCGATLFNTLQTAFRIALFDHTESADVTVGTPVANRTLPAIRETMGYFSTIVPIRAQIDPADPFAVTLQHVQENSVEAFSNVIPFAELVSALAPPRVTNENPLFEVRFALQNHPIPDTSAPGFAVRMRMRSTGTARFDLACEITEAGNALEVAWLSRPAFIPAAELAELHRLFRAVLTSACRNENVPVRPLVA